MRQLTTTPQDVAKKFQYWQTRTIVATMIGYAMFYFVRKNLSIAMPAMQLELGITKTDLGLFLTLHGLLYGVSRFANGILGDRVNSRYFMVTGLVLCAFCNILFGFSSTVLILGIMWVLNGWFQGMGFPPCVRLLTHWIPPKQLATKMSIWNTSHSIGAGLVVIICGYVVNLGWRWCFFFPSIVALLGAVFLWFALRDTPSSVGLPELNITKKEKKDEDSKEFKQIIRKRVFCNPYIWILAFANFFVYTVRYAVLDWGPTLLGEWKGISIEHASWMVAGFEISGIIGMLVAGWATDRFFGGRGPRVCVICMIMSTVFITLFWGLNHPPMWMAALILGCAGFFIYGPQALVGIAAANIATQEAAASAAGFTGLFGYASTLISGWGLGLLAQTMGWNYAIGALIIFGSIGAVVFMLAWKAKANGYEEDEKK
ncbi:MFS transporter [Bacteroides faecichinchillae]|uniref:MFS transporter, OPA family, glycerol-3-phosphate transporter/MFS transporter, OPA family, sugar phosphate sensor protein UhpC n=1 Tax=Bacteroides faecichinchillae TaxID=871325 RepID=A0A1M4WE13_9BACE|nr:MULTISPECIES: MFS transporter [Bacteroides]THG68023.1 MFS transporter [Bacteroides faecichinchillae]SHE79212.1 MFS transporter, OPA family, glycerol-3-phosphate transporter/MFS transporter, OPA family, sugar phosphate sensor protein UhpC [Bacteroides faecichinchillae]